MLKFKGNSCVSNSSWITIVVVVGQACKMRTNLNRFASLVIIVWWCVLFISHTISKSLIIFLCFCRDIMSDKQAQASKSVQSTTNLYVIFNLSSFYHRWGWCWSMIKCWLIYHELHYVEFDLMSEALSCCV